MGNDPKNGILSTQYKRIPTYIHTYIHKYIHRSLYTWHRLYSNNIWAVWLIVFMEGEKPPPKILVISRQV